MAPDEGQEEFEEVSEELRKREELVSGMVLCQERGLWTLLIGGVYSHTTVV